MQGKGQRDTQQPFFCARLSGAGVWTGDLTADPAEQTLPTTRAPNKSGCDSCTEASEGSMAGLFGEGDGHYGSSDLEAHA